MHTQTFRKQYEESLTTDTGSKCTGKIYESAMEKNISKSGVI